MRLESHPPLAVVLVAGGLTIPSAAYGQGEWQMSYRADGIDSPSENGGEARAWFDGTGTGPDYDSATGFTKIVRSPYNPWQYRPSSKDSAVPSDGSNPFYRQTTAFSGGSITFRLKWVQKESDGREPAVYQAPPKLVVLNIWGGNGASASGATSQSVVMAHFGDVDGEETSGAFVAPGGQEGFGRSTATNVTPLKITLLVPEGTSEVEYTLPLSARARTAEMDVTSNGIASSSEAYHSVLVSDTEIGVGITSDIEPSWKKWTGPVGALPDVYKERNPSTNGYLNVPNLRAQLVAPHPTNPGEDIWRLQILPSSSGTMIVQSAAEWTTTPDGNFKAWLGGSRFTAIQEGIENPSYSWTTPPQSHRPNTAQTPEMIDLRPGLPLAGVPFFGIHLGSNPNGSDLVNSSTVSVAVSGSNITGSIPCNYLVDWHVPQEWAPNPYRSATLPPTIFAQSGYIVDSQNQRLENHEPNRTVNFQIEPAVTTYTAYTKDNVSTAATVLGSGADAVGVIVVTEIIVGGVTVSNPVGWLALALGVAAGGASYVAGQMPEPTPDIGHTDYAQYKAAMKFQKIINDARSLDPNAYPNVTLSRCDNPVAVDDAVAEINRVEQSSLTTPSPWEQDKFFHQDNGKLKCRVTAGREQKSDFYKGDEFDKHGYVGRCRLEVNRPQDVFYVYKWTYTPNTQPPPAPNQTPAP